MTEKVLTKKAPGVPAPPPDAENEALIDAEKTFKITVIGAVLFGLASLFIILRTRMG
ncbi:MAG: hypothetical protein O2958_01710 [Gemmatimonadetes bacterium]|nr:hypothetical protein [Gemmatimonadota bacterium]MDA1102184.1 hypothetical protein [Gemmatimonadota bacterium]